MKFSQKRKGELKELNKTELVAYIEKLHKLLKKNTKKLRKYKEKFRVLLKQVNDESKHATDNEEETTAPPDPKVNSTEDAKTTGDLQKQDDNIDDEDVAATAAFDFVAEIRQVAEEAQNLNGFVYEPTSGLYYDQKTGYYYNAEYGLYYDGNTGCYYNYNREKNSFEFHSQVPVQATTKTNDAQRDDGHYSNAGNSDNEDDNVEFDEWGVITDKLKLQKIKEQRQKLHEQKTNRYKTNKEKAKKTSVEVAASATKRHSKTHKPKRRKYHHHDSATEEHSDTNRAESTRTQHTKHSPSKEREEFEDGELSSSSDSVSSCSSGSNSGTESEADVPIFKAGGRYQDIAKKYPPSLRIIVQETNLEELTVGNLSLITFKGGTLGREGDHDVLIPDLNVSKCHLKFSYETEKGIYKVVDLGSQNGTVLNGVRMSASKTESIGHDLVHGSVIQINQTKLLCHVHDGLSTCGLCEPGLLIETTRETSSAAVAPVMLTHKEQLKKLQRKYGLENEKFVEGGGKSTAGNYNDRAATRRTEVGSSTDKEKTQIASVDNEIPSVNKGFQMLSKLGWNKGEALGKSTAGLLEPINVSGNTGTTGLGCENSKPAYNLTAAEKKKIAAWKKVQERYEKTTDIFSVSDSDDNN